MRRIRSLIKAGNSAFDLVNEFVCRMLNVELCLTIETTSVSVGNWVQETTSCDEVVVIQVSYIFRAVKIDCSIGLKILPKIFGPTRVSDDFRIQLIWLDHVGRTKEDVAAKN